MDDIVAVKTNKAVKPRPLQAASIPGLLGMFQNMIRLLVSSAMRDNAVEFDHSGSYAAIAGSDVRVYQVANVKVEWNCIKTLPDLSGTGKMNCVKFGPDAKYMAMVSMDRNLRIFGMPRGGSEES